MSKKDIGKHRSSGDQGAGPTSSVGSDARADIGQAIGSKLRKLYSDAAEAPIPDRFTDLLNQLDSGKKKGQSNE
ncbi:MAG: NepR family anti-sigma factor [Beijerinckiaceae bacterium]